MATQGMRFPKKKRLVPDLEEDPDDIVPDEEKELSELVSWNLWRTRIDQVAFFNPIHMMQYFFVQHSTGPSYAYFLFTLFTMAAWTLVVTYRHLRDDRIEETAIFSFHLSSEYQDLGYHPFLLPILTGFQLLNSAGVNATTAAKSLSLENTGGLMTGMWETCTQIAPSKGSYFLDPFHPSAVCTKLDTTACDVLNPVSSMHASPSQCISEPSKATLKGAPYDKTFPTVHAEDNVWVYLRYSIDIPTASITDNLSVRFQGRRVNALIENLEKCDSCVLTEGVFYQEAATNYFPLRVAETQQVYFEYEPTILKKLARYWFDDDKLSFVRYKDFRHSRRKAFVSDVDVTKTRVFQASFTLSFQTRVVYQKRITFIDLIAVLSSVMFLLYSIGFVVRVYNKWHFLTFGRWELANLPVFYTDCLFDPLVQLDNPGLKEMVAMAKEKKKFKVRSRDVVNMHDDIGKIRSLLDAIVYGPVKSSKIEEN